MVYYYGDQRPQECPRPDTDESISQTCIYFFKSPFVAIVPKPVV